MLFYPQLNSRWKRAVSAKDLRGIEDYLVGVWLDDYYRLMDPSQAEVVETTVTSFSYLFDIKQERLIAAWGISKGKSDERRDKSRMRGHPLGAGKGYHRGHVIPHTLGGGTDINLVAQRGSINIGPFRVLEIQAVKTPGALYFTYWEYQNLNIQKPLGMQQGLLCPGQNANIRWFRN